MFILERGEMICHSFIWQQVQAAEAVFWVL